MTKNPPAPASEKLPSRCVPCEAGAPPLDIRRVKELFAGLKGWELVENKKIRKMFKFKDFAGAKYFLDIISVIAEEQGHHPDFSISYNKVTVTLSTHAIGGLSDNDFIMARIIDGTEGSRRIN
ncbi:4a-hydroxytetrahydrobiopterin dehydratase [bacterium]|nr:4a-hydroxytetrahydrobiopterin dehydratase [bacterium]